MSSIYYLDWNAILQIHADALTDSGGSAGIRLEGPIESAIVAPQTNYFGEERYPTLAEKAAIMCYELVKQHPFIDGNKRVGHGAMVHFLFMNGYILDAEDNDQYDTIMRLAASELTKEEFFDWVKKVIAPIK